MNCKIPILRHNSPPRYQFSDLDQEMPVSEKDIEKVMFLSTIQKVMMTSCVKFAKYQIIKQIYALRKHELYLSYTPFMRTLISILIFFLSISCFGQHQKQIVFKKTDYPASKFITTADTSNLGQLQIVRTMVTPKASSNGFVCRSWLTIRKTEKVLKQKFYDIEPVGGCSGLYLPALQPLDNYFIISKFGDYEGETLLIDTTGKLIELTGGPFSVSADKKYLFSIWDSDVSGITVYDLTKGKTVLRKEIEDDKQYGDIYFKDGKFYVSYFKDTTVAQIDIQNKNVVAPKKPISFLKKTNMLKVYNDVQTLTKCNCGRK